MKKILILLLLICANAKISYAMEKNPLDDNPNASINNSDQNIDQNADNTVQNNLVQNNQVAEESNIVFAKRLLKCALVKFMTTELLNQGVVITSIKDTFTNSKKHNIKKLFNILVKDGINTQAIAKNIAQEIDCDPEIIAQILEKITQKDQDKKSIFRKAVEKLSSESINKLKNIAIGGAIAALSWSVGHGLFHNSMESMEPETMADALPLALTTAAVTCLLYNSSKVLSFLRNKLINIMAIAGAKLINLDSYIDPVIGQIGQHILDATPSMFFPTEIKESADENPEKEAEEVTGVERKTTDNIDNADNSQCTLYEDFIATLTQEQKEILKQYFGKIDLDIIIRVAKSEPKLLLKSEAFQNMLEARQLGMLADLMHETEE